MNTFDLIKKLKTISNLEGVFRYEQYIELFCHIDLLLSQTRLQLLIELEVRYLEPWPVRYWAPPDSLNSGSWPADSDTKCAQQASNTGGRLVDCASNVTCQLRTGQQRPVNFIVLSLSSFSLPIEITLTNFV